MNYKITHTTQYKYSEAVPVCHNILHLAPRVLPIQMRHDFRLLVHPEPNSIDHSTDYFGNDVSHFSIEHAHLGLAVTASSDVTVLPKTPFDPEKSMPWEKVSDLLQNDRSRAVVGASQFVFDSPGVRRFPDLVDYAKKSFTVGRPILAAAIDLTSRIYNDFKYDPRATTVHTEIDEVFENRHGVCQDFAHLQIGCLRSLGLAARYVSGYLRTQPPPGKPRLVGADASHAWVSVFCGDAGWVDLDPTNDTETTTDHITVAWGRDFNDVCPIKGTIIGGGEHRMTVSVDVAPDATESKHDES